MALIKCPDCGKEISPRAPACPGCGAPNEAASQTAAPAASKGEFVIDESTIHEQLAESQGGKTCPFCKHFVPKDATVCRCGAYYGYKTAGAHGRFKFFGALTVIAIVCIVVALIIGPHEIGNNAVAFIGVIVAFFALLGTISNAVAMGGDPGWWRSR